MPDEQEIVKSIHEATKELDEARDVVRNLANDLAEVADVIEPILTEQSQRIRRARMQVIDECRQTAVALKEFRDILQSNAMLSAIERAERLISACKELEEFRACGFLDAFLEAFAGVGNRSVGK